ncbi:MarR family winged helix-turn-helix transcriptional regulator [Candidatus Rariloculus sp.]|uniref:MarR family winged helix-turn-helix transcriptional regulator n=1 Tax=Candidatus Rariloculus sp. TaxID=3101265 RepID=UPI003D0B05B3
MLTEHGLSDAEFHLLAAIRTYPELPSPRDLLDPLMVTSGGLTNRIDRLEAAGLLERVANPADRRGVHLKLTPRGLDIVDRVTTAYLSNQNALLDGALDPAERTQLASLLQRLLASLSASGNWSESTLQRRRHPPRLGRADCGAGKLAGAQAS